MNFSIKAIYDWYRDSLRNPKYRWWIVAGTMTYLFSPFDISPDFFPILGQIDDVALLTLLVAELSRIFIEGYQQRQVKTPSVDHPLDTKTVDVDATPVQE
ncbi:MAG: DUF1232 domain-containing protein [Acaryochloridaceae cyanobacterium SU_2_1]|nr:DUF1232 domain-containing protein [Acaryochloridaceae cyanobacterium SU_2_1]NJM95024.1 DUF1232 domain-containing protein [Acaryochloridaceae cyanobacterium CSU_5_19]